MTRRLPLPVVLWSLIGLVTFLVLVSATQGAVQILVAQCVRIR